jgi:hypothetical protein
MALVDVASVSVRPADGHRLGCFHRFGYLGFFVFSSSLGSLRRLAGSGTLRYLAPGGRSLRIPGRRNPGMAARGAGQRWGGDGRARTGPFRLGAGARRRASGVAGVRRSGPRRRKRCRAGPVDRASLPGRAGRGPPPPPRWGGRIGGIRDPDPGERRGARGPAEGRIGWPAGFDRLPHRLGCGGARAEPGGARVLRSGSRSGRGPGAGPGVARVGGKFGANRRGTSEGDRADRRLQRCAEPEIATG